MLTGLALAACAHTQPAPCRVAAIPLAARAKDGGLEQARQGVRTDCRLLEAQEIRQRLPTTVYSLDPSQKERLLEILEVGESLVYTDEFEEGFGLLSRAFDMLQLNPALLPQDPAGRNSVYVHLMPLLRRLADQNPEKADLLCQWLAVHMPEQSPSVHQLPPLVEGRASKALETHLAGTTRLTVNAAPAGCDTPVWAMVDGREIGQLPVLGIGVPRGEHAVWFRCGASSSWVRTVDGSGELLMPPPDMALEPWVSLADGEIAVLPSAAPALKDAIARAAERWLDVQAVVLVPPELENFPVEPSDKASADDEHSLTELRPILLDASSLEPASRWTKTAAYVDFSASVLLLGAALTTNYVHNARVDDLNSGLTDPRSEIAALKTASIACYIGSGAMLVAGTTFLLLELFARNPPVPTSLFYGFPETNTR